MGSSGHHLPLALKEASEFLHGRTVTFLASAPRTSGHQLPVQPCVLPSGDVLGVVLGHAVHTPRLPTQTLGRSWGCFGGELQGTGVRP